MDSYEVEKLISRGMWDGEAHYYVKWQNYGNLENTWEPVSNLVGCDDLIENLDVEMATKILGTKKVGAEVKFLLDYKDFWPINQISYADAVEKFPHLLKKFYENHLEMIDDPHATGVGFAVAETQNTVGDPMRVTYASDLVGEVHYWLEWPLQKGKFSSGDEFMGLKLRFLESKLVWPAQPNYFFSLPQRKKKDGNDKNVFIGSQMVTRSKMGAIISGNFLMPNVAVKRDRALEKCLLEKSRPINRRHTIGMVRRKSILKTRSTSIGGAIASQNGPAGPAQQQQQQQQQQPQAVSVQQQSVSTIVSGSNSGSFGGNSGVSAGGLGVNLGGSTSGASSNSDGSSGSMTTMNTQTQHQVQVSQTGMMNSTVPQQQPQQLPQNQPPNGGTQSAVTNVSLPASPAAITKRRSAIN